MSDAAEQQQRVADFVRVADPAERVLRACEWAARLYGYGLSVAVLTENGGEAEEIDEKLWTFRDTEFVPHVIRADAAEPVIERVLIYLPGEEPEPADAVINAAGGEPPADAGAYARVVDFAEEWDEEAKEAGRRRFQACRDAGFRMVFHKGE